MKIQVTKLINFGGTQYISTILFGLSVLLLILANCIGVPIAHALSPYTASAELGQLNQFNQSQFTNNYVNNTQPLNVGLNMPYGMAIDAANHHLFVSDSANSRVLVYQLNTSNHITSQSASYEIGEPDMYTNSSSISCVINQASLCNPTYLAYDSTTHQLYVSDTGNNRVLAYNISSLSNGMNANFVLGQPDFTSNSCSTTQTNLCAPRGLAFDTSTHRLFVADSENIRTIIYSTHTLNNGKAASFVLGQPDFTSSDCNATQSGLCSPSGLVYDSSQHLLFVSDSYDRVMAFNITGLSNGMNASFVLGQPDFVSSGCDTTQTTMCDPGGLAFDPVNNLLFVADSGGFKDRQGNSRVLTFDTASLSNGEAASNVLGQSDFTSSNCQTTQSGVCTLSGLVYDSVSSQLFVADASNNRVLDFNTSSLSNGMSSSAVLGQVDNSGSQAFTTKKTNDTNSPSAKGLYEPLDVAIDTPGHRLFVADTSNNRILVYNLDANNEISSQSASFVLGQPDFMSNSCSTTRAGMCSPWGLTYDPGSHVLFVADGYNNRILVFDASNLSNGENANYELGQPDFASSDCLVSQSSLCVPSSLAYNAEGHQLYVADAGNSRVLVYNTSNLSNGMNASFVLGHSVFDSPGCGAPQQNILCAPAGVAYDPADHLLFTSDNNNNRIMVYNTSNLSNGMNASFVLGQPDYSSNSCSNTQTGVCDPGKLTYDTLDRQLFVSDTANNRVLVFDAGNLNNGEDATYVLGQPDFTSNACATTQSGLCNPFGLAYDTLNRHMFIVDTANNRVVQMSFIQLNKSLPAGKVDHIFSAPLVKHAQGAQTISVVSGSLPPGLTIDNKNGALRGIPKVLGTYTFRINASDNNGNAGIYTYTASYRVTIDGSNSIIAGSAIPIKNENNSLVSTDTANKSNSQPSINTASNSPTNGSALTPILVSNHHDTAYIVEASILLIGCGAWYFIRSRKE